MDRLYIVTLHNVPNQGESKEMMVINDQDMDSKRYYAALLNLGPSERVLEDRKQQKEESK